ncbi:MAG: DUF4112 domain-containing protein [Chthoniobacteraceae bacterium]
MADKPVREIEVEVLPPETARAEPRVEPPGDEPRVYTRDTSEPPPPPFEDPFAALIARLMDSAFTVPGTNFRFGLDPVIGLVAGYGDAASALTSLLLLWRSAGYGVPKIVLTQMAMNIVLNATVGAIPLIGDAFSFWFKSNVRNYELLKAHANTAASTRPSWIFVSALLVGISGVLLFTVFVYWTMLVLLGQLLGLL